MRIAPPIATHTDDIDMIGMDIAHLLFPAVLRNNEVYVAYCLEHFPSNLVGIEALLSFEGVELVG